MPVETLKLKTRELPEFFWSQIKSNMHHSWIGSQKSCEILIFFTKTTRWVTRVETIGADPAQGAMEVWTSQRTPVNRLPERATYASQQQRKLPGKVKTNEEHDLFVLYCWKNRTNAKIVKYDLLIKGPQLAVNVPQLVILGVGSR